MKIPTMVFLLLRVMKEREETGKILQNEDILENAILDSGALSLFFASNVSVSYIGVQSLKFLSNLELCTSTLLSALIAALFLEIVP